jgi:glutathione S-transferase
VVTSWTTDAVFTGSPSFRNAGWSLTGNEDGPGGLGLWVTGNGTVTNALGSSSRTILPSFVGAEELGLPYELVMLPFPPRVLARSYLDVNPLGTIPLLVDGSTRMTESVAICQYLCALRPTPLQVVPGEDHFGAYLNYLHFGEATLTFPQTLVLRYARFEPEHLRQPAVAEDYAKWFLARLRTLEPILTERAYLCAGRFTAADVSVGYALMLAQHVGLTERFTPAVAAYWDRLQQRDAYLRGLRSQEAAALAQGVSTAAAPDTLPLAP